MEESTIQYQGSISWKNFAKAQRIHMKSQWIGLMLFPAIFAPLIWIQQVSVLTKILASLLALLFVPFMMAFQMIAAYRSYKRSPYLQEPIKGFVSDEFLRTENGLGTSEMEWKMFTKHIVTNDCILLYSSPQGFNFLTKEFFASENDWNEARKIVGAKMRKRA
jgi:hypothetical protein